MDYKYECYIEGVSSNSVLWKVPFAVTCLAIGY